MVNQLLCLSCVNNGICKYKDDLLEMQQNLNEKVERFNQMVYNDDKDKNINFSTDMITCKISCLRYVSTYEGILRKDGFRNIDDLELIFGKKDGKLSDSTLTDDEFNSDEIRTIIYDDD